MRAELVLRGGRVFTGLEHRPFCEALAVQGGRVSAVGDEREVRRLVGRGTRVVELGGRLAVPGFHDSHTHLMGAGLIQEELSLLGAKTPEECTARVKERIRDGDWVVGRGWDADLFPGGAWPDRKVLDAAAPRTPVLLLRRDGHAAWVNARALEVAGIAADTKDPPHGAIVRDARGEATGILLEEPAISLVRSKVPAPTLERRTKAVERGLELARSLGVTTFHDDASYDDRLRPGEVYGALLARKKLTARVVLWQRLGRPIEELRAERAELPPSTRLAYGLLKGFLDGSLGSRTALLHEPYCDHSGDTGMPLVDPRVLEERVLEAHHRGFQVGLHAIGDRAAAVALDAFAAVARVHGAESLRAARHRIEHGQIWREADIARCGALGVVASVQPVHLASDMKIALARLGPERCRTSYPWRALIEAGAPLAFGTDYPVESMDPLRGLYCAVTRRSPDERDGSEFFPGQRLSREEALLAYTRGSAFAAHCDDHLGQLAPGRLADVAVLSEDVFAIPVSRLPDVRCDMTLVEGECVFERG
ncbi:MAG TPA: amidohydrolase [Planctomycetota bacterium]|nr:amidohydrolase [Planctomycetota bacterium]